jgi:hypothetical protein
MERAFQKVKKANRPEIQSLHPHHRKDIKGGAEIDFASDLLFLTVP